MPLGYRVVSFSLETLQASTLMERKPVDLTPGSVHAFNGGLFLGTDEGFTQYYLGGTDDQDVILTFEFAESDILSGDLGPNSEVRVKKGILKAARFEDGNLQARFGHLLDPTHYNQRRSTNRGTSHRDEHGPKRVAVLRAMDNRIGHLHPMDYVYCAEPGAFQAMSKRVLKAYEDGEPLTRQADRLLLKALEHAVTTALYEGEAQQVAYAVLANHQVYNAPNPGEYFYDAQGPVKTVKLMEIDEQGTVTLHSPEKRQENSLAP